MNAPSRFISEIPEDLLTDLRKEQKEQENTERIQHIKGIKHTVVPQDWAIGDKANHVKWGIGVVVSTQNEGEDLELQIAFPKPIGIKRLLAKFAPIEKVE